MEQARVATPVDWLYAPQWLDPLQAARLTGHDPAVVQWLIDDGAVETDDSGLIWRDDLLLFQETLADVLHSIA